MLSNVIIFKLEMAVLAPLKILPFPSSSLDYSYEKTGDGLLLLFLLTGVALQC